MRPIYKTPAIKPVTPKSISTPAPPPAPTSSATSSASTPAWKPAQHGPSNNKQYLLGTQAPPKPTLAPTPSPISNSNSNSNTPAPASGLPRHRDQFEWTKNHDYNATYQLGSDQRFHKLEPNNPQLGREYELGRDGYFYSSPQQSSDVQIKPEGSEVLKPKKIRPEDNGYMNQDL